MKTQRGFTIIELLITLTIVGILTTLAGPSLTEMLKNNRLTTQANDFILALNLARSEAVKRGKNITITRNSGNWNNGWTVAVVTPAEILRIGDPLLGTMTLTSTSAGITFRASGAPTVAPGDFSLCDDRSGETGRTISISLTGRINVNNLTCS